MDAATVAPAAFIATKSPAIIAIPVVLSSAMSVASDEKVAAILPVLSSDVNVILPETFKKISNKEPKLVTECFPDPNVPITKRLVSESDIAESTSNDE